MKIAPRIERRVRYVLTLGLAAAFEANVASASDALDVRLEAGILGRAFRYTDPLSEHRPDLAGQRPVDNVSPATPVLRLRVESFPLAPLSGSWLGHLGLHADVQGGLPTSVRGGPNQPVLGQQSQGQLLLGGQGRIPVQALELLPRIAWGLHGWYLSPSSGTERPFPNLTYELIEVGLRVRGVVDALSLEADFGWRTGLSAGEVASPTWFPNTSFVGMTTGVAAGWAFHPQFELRVHLEFIQYGLTFAPDVGSPPERVVGGATDQSVLATMGVSWRLPGYPD